MGLELLQPLRGFTNADSSSNLSNSEARSNSTNPWVAKSTIVSMLMKLQIR